MRRATLGNLLNYLTSLAAQVLFARRFGANGDAAAYVITFGLMAAISGVFTNNIQSIVLPRLVDSEGSLQSGALRLLAQITGAATVIALGLLIVAGPFSSFLAEHAGLTHTPLESLLRISALALLLQIIAGEIAAFCLAKGGRFLPAVAPAFPSIAVSAILIANRGADVTAVYLAFTAGSLLQVAALTVLAAPSVRLVSAETRGVGGVAIVQLTSAALLGFIGPLERVVAASHSATDAALYDYALRSLAAVLSIMIGGMVLAGLGTWSSMSNAGELDTLKHSMAKAAYIGALALTLAASVALASIHSLVELLYQHGRFTASDTTGVATLILIALPGFVAQGLSLVFTSALSATRHNREVIATGFFNFTLRFALILGMAALWGVEGIAVAYSVSSVAMAIGVIVVTVHLGLWPQQSTVIRRYALVGLGTAAAGGLLATLGADLPPAARGAGVLVVFAFLYRTAGGGPDIGAEATAAYRSGRKPS